MSEWTEQDIEDYYEAHPEQRPEHVASSSNKMVEPMKAEPSKYRAQRTHPEKDLEQFVHDTARACGLLYYHTYRSRFSEPGFPDCVIIGKWMLVAELKDTGKKLTPAQHKWLLAFSSLHVDTRLWRPEDKDGIIKTLQGMKE